MTTHHTTLGFEIEYARTADVDQALNLIRQAGSENGITSLSEVIDDRGTYSGFSPTRWAQKYDCSCGWEIKSPPIRETEEVKHVMSAIRAAGGTVNENCGLHIHIGVASLSLSSLKRLAKIYARHELSLNELLPIQRRHSASYATSNRSTYSSAYFNPRTGDLTALFAAIDACSSIVELQQVACPRGKYSKCNLRSITSSKKTVEFRAHQGTLNFQKIDAWASLVTAIVRNAEDATEITPKESTFEEMLSELTVRATRTPRQPREGTIARQVWNLMDSYYGDTVRSDGGLVSCSCAYCSLFKTSGATASGHALRFQDARDVVKDVLNLTQAQVHGPIQKWSRAHGLTRRPSGSVEGLAAYLSDRRAALFARATRRSPDQAAADQARA